MISVCSHFIPLFRAVLTIEILERGEHTLEVGVTYTAPLHPHARTFRKLYNFTTFDTIAIRSQSRTLPSRSVLFQMHVENTGDSTLFVKRVRFHAEAVWVARSCNELPPGREGDAHGDKHGDGDADGDGDKHGDRDADGGVGVFMDRGLEAKSVYQVMFLLFPKGGVEGEMPFHLGRLEIDWVGSMGEKGSLITGMMKRRPL